MSPPKEVGPDANSAKANTPDPRQRSRTNQDSRFDDFAARGRRRAAAVRSTVISTCPCIRDPEVDRHRCVGGITDKMAEAAVVAAEHLQLLDTPGLFDRSTCQAMWRAGHHELAAESFRYTHGEAA
jgi:hypothetical protein